MMTTYIRPGGLWRDVPVEFETAVRDFLEDHSRARIDEYEALLTKNPLFLDRTMGIGDHRPARLPRTGASPARSLRASGVH